MFICRSFVTFVLFLSSSLFSDVPKVKPFKLDIVGKKKGADLGTFGGSLGLLRSFTLVNQNMTISSMEKNLIEFHTRIISKSTRFFHLDSGNNDKVISSLANCSGDV